MNINSWYLLDFNEISLEDSNNEFLKMLIHNKINVFVTFTRAYPHYFPYNFVYDDHIG